MRRRLFAACAVLVVLASVMAMPLSASRSCCCRKTACAMHQKHDGGGCRLDRCRDRDDAAFQAPAVRAVLVAVTLPHPAEQHTTFATARHAAQRRAVTPLHPPPRVV